MNNFYHFFTTRVALLFMILPLLVSCVSNSQKAAENNEVTSTYTDLKQEQLAQLGIFISDSAVVYNNVVEGVGAINIVIKDTEYFGNIATTSPTGFAFYPRYITTLDTLQRSAYLISGSEYESEQEAQKWQSFDNLIPIVVEQRKGEIVFGETLIFWMTKTPELERLLKDIKEN